MDWLIGTLLFISGFIFSRVLYFFTASALSYKIMKAANLSALHMFVKSFERLVYYNNLALADYVNRGESERNIEIFQSKLDDELSLFKDRCVGTLLETTPSLFRQSADFEDWTSAMVYLHANRQFVLELINDKEND